MLKDYVKTMDASTISEIYKIEGIITEGLETIHVMEFSALLDELRDTVSRSVLLELEKEIRDRSGWGQNPLGGPGGVTVVTGGGLPQPQDEEEEEEEPSDPADIQNVRDMLADVDWTLFEPEDPFAGREIEAPKTPLKSFIKRRASVKNENTIFIMRPEGRIASTLEALQWDLKDAKIRPQVSQETWLDPVTSVMMEVIRVIVANEHADKVQEILGQYADDISLTENSANDYEKAYNDVLNELVAIVLNEKDMSKVEAGLLVQELMEDAEVNLKRKILQDLEAKDAIELVEPAAYYTKQRYKVLLQKADGLLDSFDYPGKPVDNVEDVTVDLVLNWLTNTKAVELVVKQMDDSIKSNIQDTKNWKVITRAESNWTGFTWDDVKDNQELKRVEAKHTVAAYVSIENLQLMVAMDKQGDFYFTVI